VEEKKLVCRAGRMKPDLGTIKMRVPRKMSGKCHSLLVPDDGP
jgi:hypothetical protein